LFKDGDTAPTTLVNPTERSDMQIDEDGDDLSDQCDVQSDSSDEDPVDDNPKSPSPKERSGVRDHEVPEIAAHRTSDTPYNEFSENDLLYYETFPWLFPFGEGLPFKGSIPMRYFAPPSSHAAKLCFCNGCYLPIHLYQPAYATSNHHRGQLQSES
jgi:hypothetical protein